MQQELQGVLKRNRVKPAGPCRVGGEGASAGSPAGAAQARIVKQEQGWAVIEVACACGQKIYVQCTYATA